VHLRAFATLSFNFTSASTDIEARLGMRVSPKHDAQCGLYSARRQAHGSFFPGNPRYAAVVSACCGNSLKDRERLTDRASASLRRSVALWISESAMCETAGSETRTARSWVSGGQLDGWLPAPVSSKM
jgi:hypothetical protein